VRHVRFDAAASDKAAGSGRFLGARWSGEGLTVDRRRVTMPAMSPPNFGDTPTRPCPRCGAVVQVHRYEASTLRLLKWSPFEVVSVVRWRRSSVEPGKESREVGERVQGGNDHDK